MAVDWETLTVGELIDKKIIEKPLDGNHGGTHPKGADFIETGIPFVMASDINNGQVDLINCKFISKKQADTLRKGFSQQGDILLTHKASIGRTAIVPEIDSDYIMLTPQVTYYRVRDKSKLFNKYLKYYFDSSTFQSELNTRAGSGSTRAYIGITDQKFLKVVLPPLEEQKAIASILSAIDDKIENNLQMNNTLEEMAMALYKHWFVDFGPFQNGEFVDSELGKIPKGWEVKTLCKLANFKNGKGLKRDDINETGLYKVFGSNGIIGKTDKYLFDEPVVAIGRVGANYGEVHYCIEPCWISDNAVTVQPLKQRYFWWVLQTLRLIDYSNFVAGSAQPLITQGAIKQVNFAVPHEDILIDFSMELSLLFNQLQNNLKENQTLTTLRNTLLPKLISGEVRLKDVEKTLSEVLWQK